MDIRAHPDKPRRAIVIVANYGELTDIVFAPSWTINMRILRRFLEFTELIQEPDYPRE